MDEAASVNVPVRSWTAMIIDDGRVRKANLIGIERTTVVAKLGMI